jgi:hypothetical protein
MKPIDSASAKLSEMLHIAAKPAIPDQGLGEDADDR